MSKYRIVKRFNPYSETLQPYYCVEKQFCFLWTMMTDFIGTPICTFNSIEEAEHAVQRHEKLKSSDIKFEEVVKEFES